MVNETQAHLDVEMFAFRHSEIAGILEAAQLKPTQGSPFKDLSAEVDESAREVAVQAGPGVLAAATRIAVPDRVIGMVTAAPPEPADFLWLYGGHSDLDLAYHQEDETGLHRIAWPVDGLALLDLAAAPLDLYGPVEHHAVSLSLGREEFSALVAITDFVQADALQGILRHDLPLPEPPTFRIEDLVALAERSTQTEDLRWMVTRAGLMSPIQLNFGEATLRHALGSLEENGLLQEAGGLFEVTPLLHQLCLLAGTCTGLSAVSTRNRGPETGAWSLEHFAISRGPGSLLLFEFADVAATDFLVSIDDITPALAFEWLQGGLLFEDTPEAGMDEPAQEAGLDERSPGPEPVMEPALPNAPMGTTTAPPSQGQGQQWFCPSCGTVLRVGLGFCTSCGAPVKGEKNNA